MNGEKCIYLVVENNHRNDYGKDDDNSIHYSRRKTSNNKKSDNDDQTVEFVKRDMNDSQIDVSYYIAKGLLYIGASSKQFYYESVRRTKKSYEFFKSILPNSFYNVSESSYPSSSTQYRLVLDVKSELHTMNYNLAYLLELEQLYHTIFHSLRGSSICSYLVQDLEQTLSDYSEYGKLTTVRLNSHSGVIFARKFAKGLALALE
jgi:hypothetical protein